MTDTNELLENLRSLISSEAERINASKVKVSTRLAMLAAKGNVSVDEVIRHDPDVSFTLGGISADELWLGKVQHLIIPHVVEESMKDL